MCAVVRWLLGVVTLLVGLPATILISAWEANTACIGLLRRAVVRNPMTLGLPSAVSIGQHCEADVLRHT